MPGTSSLCHTSASLPPAQRKICRGTYQDRLAYSGLMWRFLWDIHQAVLEWARWAQAEVSRWPADLARIDVTAEFARIVATARDWPGS